MAEASPRDPKHRRKVRKGTQSCWECRRRKVRCIFTAAANLICENCKRRGTACNSQLYSSVPTPMPSAGSNQVRTQVETQLEDQVEDQVGTRPSQAEDVIEYLINIPNSRVGIPTPEVEADASFSRSSHNVARRLSKDNYTHSRPPLKRHSSATITSPAQRRRTIGKYEELSKTLAAAWPSQPDIDLICALPVGLSVHLHSSICTPYSSSMHQDPPSPQKMLRLPSLSSHPVLIARKLLLLGTYLQGVVPSSLQNLPDLGVSFRNIMARVVDTAIRLVTTNEDLIDSVEGIECIMLEAMYQNYAGNLHRAWMAVRRAITVAEMMALHRGLTSSSLKILELETQAAFNPDQTCFRLVEMECYLSLMLGLPRTSLQARFATPKALEECQPIDRMQRIHCAATDRILQRRENNFSETHDINMLLQKAAAEMPPQWWLIPNLSASNSGGTEVLHGTYRLMAQFTHYHLLIRLHLPYMLRSSHDREYDHSKITVVNMSRETLTRYIAFRTSNPAHFYCRGTDFLVFIAATVLCFAHIDACGQCQTPAQVANPGKVFNYLAHSRPSDRGMMECTLNIIETMALDSSDAIASKISRILRHLLAIEADAASGTSYSTKSSKCNNEALECHGKLTNGGKGLYVHIPFFGTISFERRSTSNAISTAPMRDVPITLDADILALDHPGEVNPRLPSGPNYQVVNQQNYPNTQTAQMPVDQLVSPQQLPQFSCYGTPSFSSGNDQEDQLHILGGLAGAEDDWDLQGVDVALFDSLFHGLAVPDVSEDETWMQWASNG